MSDLKENILKEFVIQIEEISFGYGKKELFNQFSFEAKKGCATLLIGPNGCGKSTLINLMAGTLKPSGGKISLFGEDLRRLRAPARARLVAWLPQRDAGGFDFAVKDFLLTGLTSKITPFSSPSQDDFKQVEKAAETCSISHLLTRSLSTLSGGEQRLVWIARTIVQDSPLLLLDEPSSHLDPANAREVLDIIAGEIGKGRSVLFSLHEPNHAFYLQEKGVAVELFCFHKGLLEKVRLEDLNEEKLYEIYNTGYQRYESLDSRRYFY